MAVHSRGRLEVVNQWRERNISPERTKVWTEPKTKKNTEKKVPVVYYLSRNGHLDHPHFMEVSLSSPEGLYLTDVINRLNVLRGRGMASMYSWSSKRSYKNGFVWHDLGEGDFIYPAHNNEYVLKGSELLNLSSSPSSQDSAFSSLSSERALEVPKSCDSDHGRRKKTLWNSLDLNEYKVYKSEMIVDASTQTEDKKNRSQPQVEIPNSEEESQNPNPSYDAVLDRDEIEISPPPSSSSPETLETLTKSDGRPITIGLDDQDRTVDNYSSGRFRASAVLLQLVSCGSITVKDHRVTSFRGRMPHGGSDSGRKEMEGLIGESSFGAIKFEDKEYFSGSLIETKKKEGDGGASACPVLKRSNSYNVDRRSKLELGEKKMETARAKCMPRKSKGSGARRPEETAFFCRSAHGSKRMNIEPN